jgi:hypothetical protein
VLLKGTLDCLLWEVTDFTCLLETVVSLQESPPHPESSVSHPSWDWDLCLVWLGFALLVFLAGLERELPPDGAGLGLDGFADFFCNLTKSN